MISHEAALHTTLKSCGVAGVELEGWGDDEMLRDWWIHGGWDARMDGGGCMCEVGGRKSGK